jgi:hypothetical protein
MSKRLVNPKAPNAPVNAKETRAPNGTMPADMKSDAEARALGRIPTADLVDMLRKMGHEVY